MPAAKKSTTKTPKPKAMTTPPKGAKPKAAKPKAAKPKAAKPKAAAAPGKAAPAAAQKLSARDAATRVLTATGAALTAKELIGRMAAQGLWASPNGKTPAATLSAALQREIVTKGAASRFRKTATGRFAAATTRATDALPTPAKATKPKASGAQPKAPKTTRAPEPVAPAAAPIPDGTPGPRV